MLISQPPHHFASILCEQLDSQQGTKRQWDKLEFAVAWVNHMGVSSISESLTRFLYRGGRITATVGLDFGSTSFEGLKALLEIERQSQNLATYVFHDENQTSTFHPKLFLFSNTTEGLLFVGSNNLTGAGLSANVEAMLSIRHPIDHPDIEAARESLISWRDPLARTKPQRLTKEFLEKLLENHYVLTEREIQKKRKKEKKLKPVKRDRLFGRSKPHTQSPRSKKVSKKRTALVGSRQTTDECLLMRVRPRRNGSQFQISMAVLEGPFMQGTSRLFSVTDGTFRNIGYDHVTRNGQRVKNLARFEAPEMAGMKNPVAKFEWITIPLDSSSEKQRVLSYQLYDAENSEHGAQILQRISDGIGDPPSTNLRELDPHRTALSKANRESAQWYLIIPGLASD